MTPEEISPHLRRVMRDTRKLYTDSARWLVSRHKTLLGERADSFVELMDDLHRGLLIKVYTVVIRSDNRWSRMEKYVGSLMLEHLWDQRLQGSALREAAEGLLAHADTLHWETLVRPFVDYEPLHDRISTVETAVMRLANLVAKCDGLTTPEESITLHQIQHEITVAMGGTAPKRPTEVLPHEMLPGAKQPSTNSGQQAANQQTSSFPQRQAHKPSTYSSPSNPKPQQPEHVPQKSPEERLEEAQAELDRLIGLTMIKDRVRSLTNYLKLQRQRQLAGLPTMPLSLHMSFVGNPGTGKTTVARIVGQILGAMGILKSGHLVETDRSGLVAEYAGQTSIKTNKLIDSAIDGVLFIDEAYSLVSNTGEDQYGREAVGTLLKRMEDDRERLVVILAGYPEEMDDMIRSNPGLSSRVNNRMEFEDYLPADLGRIFELLCESNHYRLPAESRHRLLVGLDSLHRERDRHFGNGRLARNAFEECVRRLADRVADVFPLTPDLLTILQPADICIPGLKSADLDSLLQQPHTLRVTCTKCKKRLKMEGRLLGCTIRCPNCKTQFKPPWADVEKS